MVFALHIPDGFLSGHVSAAAAVLAGAALVCAVRMARVDADRVRLVGAVAAFVFAAQMLNFPVADGTSGHLLGATLAAVLLGPWLACLTMTAVLAVQALLFADGGLSALGANVLNMGVLGALLAGLALHALAPRTSAARLGVVAAVSWLAVMAGALATSLELAASGTVALSAVLPAMLGVHALIGIGEAAMTVAVVAAAFAARPREVVA